MTPLDLDSLSPRELAAGSCATLAYVLLAALAALFAFRKKEPKPLTLEEAFGDEASPPEEAERPAVTATDGSISRVRQRKVYHRVPHVWVCPHHARQRQVTVARSLGLGREIIMDWN